MKVLITLHRRRAGRPAQRARSRRRASTRRVVSPAGRHARRDPPREARRHRHDRRAARSRTTSQLVRELLWERDPRRRLRRRARRRASGARCGRSATSRSSRSRSSWTRSPAACAGCSSAARLAGGHGADRRVARRSARCSSRSSRWRRCRAPCSSRARAAPARSSSRAPSIASARGATSRSSPSTSARCRRRCSRASCSVTRRARSPARPSGGSGRFELADAGTLFLDEIGEIPLVDAGQAPARARGARGHARRRHASHPGRRARRRGDQPPLRELVEEGTLPRRPVLPAQRAAASTCRRCASGGGHPAARPAVHPRAVGAARPAVPRDLAPRRWSCSSSTRGRATSASCAISSRAWSCSSPGREIGPEDIPRQIREGGSARFLPVHIGPVVQASSAADGPRARVHPAQPGRAQAAGGGAAPAESTTGRRISAGRRRGARSSGRCACRAHFVDSGAPPVAGDRAP